MFFKRFKIGYVVNVQRTSDARDDYEKNKFYLKTNDIVKIKLFLLHAQYLPVFYDRKTKMLLRGGAEITKYVTKSLKILDGKQ